MAKVRLPQMIITELLAEAKDMRLQGYGESGNMAILYSPSKHSTYVVKYLPSGRWKIERFKGKLSVGECCGN